MRGFAFENKEAYFKDRSSFFMSPACLEFDCIETH